MARVDALVLPGVGAFGDCVRSLAASGMWDDVLAWAKSERPFFGICVGYQMLFESSEEAPGEKGSAFLPGEVRKFSDGHGLKIPQIGWNTVTVLPARRAAFGGHFRRRLRLLRPQLLRRAEGRLARRVGDDLWRHLRRRHRARKSSRHPVSPREKPARRVADAEKFCRAGRKDSACSAAPSPACPEETNAF
jgi:hypothetical protein